MSVRPAERKPRNQTMSDPPEVRGYVNLWGVFHPWEIPVMENHDLCHGYSAADIDDLTRRAVASAYSRAFGYDDRYHAAWSQIAEALCMSDTRPMPRDLIASAHSAIARFVNSEMHHAGLSLRNGDLRRMPAFAKFWDSPCSDSPESSLVEHMSLRQIVAALTADEQAALLALATYDTYGAAAEFLGISRKHYLHRVNDARRHFWRLWHEGENPAGMWGRDKRSNQMRSGTVMTVRYKRSRG